MKISDLLYLIDTRTRFCEVGAWAVTQTTSGDLIHYQEKIFNVYRFTVDML